jgi:hypothetical protein
MDNRIPPVRPDVVAVETTARPTATPPRVPFAEVLAGGARALVRGAQAALRTLPGTPLMAVAVRGGAAGVPMGPLSTDAAVGSLAPEGPGGHASAGVVVGVDPTGGLGGPGVPFGAGGAADPAAGGTDPLQSALSQDQAMNLYYLHIQEEVNAQNRTFTALSNVLEVEHNTAKAAIGNIH